MQTYRTSCYDGSVHPGTHTVRERSVYWVPCRCYQVLDKVPGTDLEALHSTQIIQTVVINPFNTSCSKLLLFEGFIAILV